jgi:integrase
MSEIPLLISFIFKEEAESVYAFVGERLLAWAKAFEEWLVEYGRTRADATVVSKARKSWREFYKVVKVMPWEVTEKDVRYFAEELEKIGVPVLTKSRRMADLSKFYDYCHNRQVDKPWAEALEGCEGFNPARKVRFPKRPDEESDQYLDLEEVAAFMEALKQDPTILGKREYAFFLGLLRTGTNVLGFARIRWKDIETEAGEVWARIYPYRPTGKSSKGLNDRDRIKRRVRLPGDAWEAIVDYLKASGRYVQMKAEHYVFAALKDPLITLPSGAASEWTEERGPSLQMLRHNLMMYCRAAGLEPSRVTFPVLFNTAIMLRLEAGDTIEEVHKFLGWKNLDYTTKRINRLLSADRKPGWSDEPARPIKRIPGWLIPREGREKHGFYAAIKPVPLEEIESVKRDPHEVEENSLLENENELNPRYVLAKSVSEDRHHETIQNEINNFRTVLDRVYNLTKDIKTVEEGIRLVEVYGMALNRLASAVKAMMTLPNYKSEFEQVMDSVLKEINDEDERKRRELREGSTFKGLNDSQEFRL